MKKIFFSLIAFFALCGSVSAQQVTADNVEALPGESVYVPMYISVNGGTYTGLEFEFQFPDANFETTTKATNDTDGEWDGSFIIGKVGGTGKENVATCGAMSINGEGGSPIPDGDLIPFGSVEIKVNEGTALGEYTISLVNMVLIKKEDGGRVEVPETTFKVNVVDVHTVVLDENATEAPATATGVNVMVKRTINANEWSTICLPFAMNAEQMAKAFGSDVKLADFNDYEVVEEGEGKNVSVVGLNVNFTTVSAIEANHPYIIKVGSAITEFAVEGVDIAPAAAEDLEINFGTTRKPHAIVGTYTVTKVPNVCLFLSGNKFWYSTGATEMQAFRAYFNFYDLLTEVEDEYAASRIKMVFDDQTTGINGVNINVDGEYYNLNGLRVETPAKGIYIKDGKKVVVK